MPESWKRGQKYHQLDEWQTSAGVKWKQLKPDSKHRWLIEGQLEEFSGLFPLYSEDAQRIFGEYSLGISTNRDDWVYGFDLDELATRSEKMFGRFFEQRLAYQRAQDKKKSKPTFDDTYLKWSDTLLRKMKGEDEASPYSRNKLVQAAYRPFCQMNLLLDTTFIDRPSAQVRLFSGERKNKLISCNTSSDGKPFFCLASDRPTDLHLTGDSTCFSFYVSNKEGHQTENILGSALSKFRDHYEDKVITKWNIFHATYAVLHHPDYRTRYAANLKRELPRIPFPPDFHAFAAAGKRLMDLHIDYEQQPEYKLEHIEHPKAEVTFRVERMKLSKDKTDLRYNDFLTLRGIPPAAFDYRLGNRSALEWVIDQYRVSTDARSGIVNDPNREDDPKYILRLIGQVITVSLETQQLIASLPGLNLGQS